MQPHAVPLHCKLATSSSCQRPPPPPPSPHLPHTAVIPGPFACRPPVPFVPCALGGSVLSPVDRPSLLVGVISNCLLSSQTKTLLPSQTSLALLIRARLCRIFYKKNLASFSGRHSAEIFRQKRCCLGRHSAEISGSKTCLYVQGARHPVKRFHLACSRENSAGFFFLSFAAHTASVASVICFACVLCNQATA